MHADVPLPGDNGHFLRPRIFLRSVFDAAGARGAAAFAAGKGQRQPGLRRRGHANAGPDGRTGRRERQQSEPALSRGERTRLYRSARITRGVSAGKRPSCQDRDSRCGV